MKALLFLLVASFFVSTALGDGSVAFGNSIAGSPIRNGLREGALVNQTDGIVVALYWAPLSDPNNFVQLGSPATVGGRTPFPGLFVGGFRTTGSATPYGGDAFFIVRAWEQAYGATFEAALAAEPMNGRPALYAESPVFRLTMPGNSWKWAVLEGTTMNPGFQGFTVSIPEPSSLLLGTIAMGFLLLLRR